VTPDSLEDLEQRLAARERELELQEQQLEKYAADLRDTYAREQENARRLKASYVATVRALANAVEARDAYTGKHAERVAAFAVRIARACDAPLADMDGAEFGFLLHDVGKVAVPDAILFKPDPLDATERALMERHAAIGWEILRDVDWLGDAKLVVRHHHERWDGRGYPDGLAGTAIPLVALTSDRPYRPRSSFPDARAILVGGAGSQFDPAVVEAFGRVPDGDLAAIAREVGA
jgi:HD-GYP domain-containing protein (c-di-GMP phosphodiesterase class II)